MNTQLWGVKFSLHHDVVFNDPSQPTKGPLLRRAGVGEPRILLSIEMLGMTIMGKEFLRKSSMDRAPSSKES